MYLFQNLAALMRQTVAATVIMGLLLTAISPCLNPAYAQTAPQSTASTGVLILKVDEINILRPREKRFVRFGRLLNPSTGAEMPESDFIYEVVDKNVLTINNDDKKRKLLTAGANEGTTFIRAIGVKDKKAYMIAQVRVVSPKKLRFDQDGPTIAPGSGLRIKAEVVDDKDVVDASANGKVTWEIDDRSNLDYVDVVAGRDNDVAVFNKVVDPSLAAKRPAQVALTAKYRDAGVEDKKIYVKLKEAEIEFQPLNVRLEVMDEQTVQDLFGRVTNKDFFVAGVNLFNNLGEVRSGGELAGESVIVSSESIEVGVSLEARYAGNDKSIPKIQKQWHPVQPAPQDKQIACGPNEHQPCITISKTTGETGCTDHPYLYRPYSYDMMSNSVDRRESRDWRSRGLTIANSLATMTGFITSFVVPGANSDLPTALEKFNSLLIPGFKEHYPSTKDAQRQNINSFAMKPTETVPFKGNLARVLFFPKSSFKGYLKNRDYEVRISGICPEYFKVKTAVTRSTDRLPVNSISGKVTDSKGAGLPDITVVLSNGSGTDQATQTDSSGDYIFPNLVAGYYTIAATLGCDDKKDKKERKINLSNNLGGVNFVADAALKLSGKVTGADDKVVKNADLVLSGGPLSVPTKTNSEGEYKFTCLPKGNYKITVTSGAHKFDPQEIDLSADDTLNFKAKSSNPATPETPPATEDTETEGEDQNHPVKAQRKTARTGSSKRFSYSKRRRAYRMRSR